MFVGSDYILACFALWQDCIIQHRNMSTPLSVQNVVHFPLYIFKLKRTGIVCSCNITESAI